ncbi:hypothetical protein MmTuc01_1076 [Methanosarcina mazei Tuc01]|uniref:Uncharacterized protein n=1 Tax=Methanosarcina mazei Tuc01 TaxID=1236903 RepID=M1QHQ1_METMZ|nr:hypothetical protein MmTuc01_1076 [Methanosarcina mazei Tuc01]
MCFQYIKFIGQLGRFIYSKGQLDRAVKGLIGIKTAFQVKTNFLASFK